MVTIDLLSLQPQLTFRSEDGKRQMWDPIRKKWLVATPEELVRQLLIRYLIRERNYPANLIQQERKLMVNQNVRRFDLLAANRLGRPMLLVECKSPEINLSDATVRQISAYNWVLSVPFLLITNGKTTYCLRLKEEGRGWESLARIPDFEEADRHSRQGLK
jgi:hypothetical protein